MTPEDVPDELIRAMADAEFDAPPGCSARDSYRTVLAAVIPEIRRQERERVAAAIEAELAADGDGSSWDGGMCNAARIARGEKW